MVTVAPVLLLLVGRRNYVASVVAPSMASLAVAAHGALVAVAANRGALTVATVAAVAATTIAPTDVTAATLRVAARVVLVGPLLVASPVAPGRSVGCAVGLLVATVRFGGIVLCLVLGRRVVGAAVPVVGVLGVAVGVLLVTFHLKLVARALRVAVGPGHVVGVVVGVVVGRVGRIIATVLGIGHAGTIVLIAVLLGCIVSARLVACRTLVVGALVGVVVVVIRASLLLLVDNALWLLLRSVVNRLLLLLICGLLTLPSVGGRLLLLEIRGLLLSFPSIRIPRLGPRRHQSTRTNSNKTKELHS